MRSIRAFYLLALLCCAITASAQNTRVDATRLVKPAASANKLFVTDGSTLPAWLDAASFFTAGTGISITGNTIANTAGLPTGTTGQTLRHDGSAWVASSGLLNSTNFVEINKTGYTDPEEVFRVRDGSTNIFSIMPRPAFSITEIMMGTPNVANNWVRLWGNTQGTSLNRLDFNAVNCFFQTGYYAGDLWLTRLGDATSGATQFNSGANRFQYSVWNGSSASSRSFELLGETTSFGEANFSLYRTTLAGTPNIAFSVNSETGNMGIGTSTPSQRLDVNGAARFRGLLYDFTNSSGGTNQTLYHNGSGLQWSSQIENDGTAVGIGGSPVWGFELYTAGAARFDGALLSRGTGTASVLSSPTLRLWNTTASTGQLWYLNSADNGNLFLDSDNTGTALAIDGTTGATTIYGELTLPSMSASAATGVLGRTSGGTATTISIGSGLSLSGGTLSATGGGGGNYQTFRDDGTGMTQRAAANYISTGTVAMALTDDAGNGETEIRATIPAGAVGDTELAATGVTAATYTNPTLSIDVNGRVTSAANGTPTVVTATSLTADADNLTASAGINVLRVSGDNGIRGITSISATGMPDGQTFRIVNTGTQPLVLQAQHPDATAGNEFLGPKDVFLPGGQSVTAVRDATADGFWVDGQPQSGQMVSSTVVSGSPTAAEWGSMTFTAGGGAISFGSDGVKHGYWTVNTASSATANPSVSLGKSTAPTSFGQAYLYSRSIVRIPTLSDGSQTFKVFTGFTSTLSLTDSPLSSAGIHYTSTFNSGKWYGYSSDASAVTTVDLGITVVANTTYVLETYSNLQRTEVRYFVDGVYRGRSTTNMPASGANVYPLCGILKQGGTTTRAVYVTEMSATYLYPN